MAIVKEKHLRNTPVLYDAIMKELVDLGKYENVNHFVTEAIREKLEKEYGSLEPIEFRNGEGWINNKWSGAVEDMVL